MASALSPPSPRAIYVGTYPCATNRLYLPRSSNAYYPYVKWQLVSFLSIATNYTFKDFLLVKFMQNIISRFNCKDSKNTAVVYVDVQYRTFPGGASSNTYIVKGEWLYTVTGSVTDAETRERVFLQSVFIAESHKYMNMGLNAGLFATAREHGLECYITPQSQEFEGKEEMGEMGFIASQWPPYKGWPAFSPRGLDEFQTSIYTLKEVCILTGRNVCTPSALARDFYGIDFTKDKPRARGSTLVTATDHYAIMRNNNSTEQSCRVGRFFSAEAMAFLRDFIVIFKRKMNKADKLETQKLRAMESSIKRYEKSQGSTQKKSTRNKSTRRVGTATHKKSSRKKSTRRKVALISSSSSDDETESVDDSDAVFIGSAVKEPTPIFVTDGSMVGIRVIDDYIGSRHSAISIFGGYGVFAKRTFAKDDVVAIYTGKISAWNDDCDDDCNDDYVTDICIARTELYEYTGGEALLREGGKKMQVSGGAVVELSDYQFIDRDSDEQITRPGFLFKLSGGTNAKDRTSASYFNHSVTPNCECDGMVTRALRDIPQWEELCWHYGLQYWDNSCMYASDLQQRVYIYKYDNPCVQLLLSDAFAPAPLASALLDVVEVDSTKTLNPMEISPEEMTVIQRRVEKKDKSYWDEVSVLSNVCRVLDLSHGAYFVPVEWYKTPPADVGGLYIYSTKPLNGESLDIATFDEYFKNGDDLDKTIDALVLPDTATATPSLHPMKRLLCTILHPPMKNTEAELRDFWTTFKVVGPPMNDDNAEKSLNELLSEALQALPTVVGVGVGANDAWGRLSKALESEKTQRQLLAECPVNLSDDEILSDDDLLLAGDDFLMIE